jgi:hypothetical protein
MSVSPCVETAELFVSFWWNFMPYRLYRDLTMVYNTQNYWVFGLFPSFGQWLRLALSKGPNRVGVSLHLRTETDPVSETSCFFLLSFKIRTMDKVRKPSNSLCHMPCKEGEMDRACRTYWGMEGLMFWSENLKRRKSSGDPARGGILDLREIWCERWTGLNWLRKWSICYLLWAR